MGAERLAAEVETFTEPGRTHSQARGAAQCGMGEKNRGRGTRSEGGIGGMG